MTSRSTGRIGALTTPSLQYGVLGIFAAATLAVIVYNGIFFTGQLPDHSWITGWNDVLLHAAAFALLTVFILPLSRSTAVPVLALAIFAALIEVAQIPMSERSASLSDVAANLAGIGLGLGFVGTVRWAKSRVFSSQPHANRQFKAE